MEETEISQDSPSTENTLINQPPVGNSSLDTKQIAGAIVVAGVIIAGAILLKGAEPAVPSGGNESTDELSSEIRQISQNDHIRGNPGASIFIVEYSDLECPFCKTFHGTLKRVIENNKKVAWVYRHFPIPLLHSKAMLEAEATECAWEQGGNDTFWRYTDRIFEVTPSNNRLPEEELPKIAGELGLDVAAFSLCLTSGKYESKVQADIEDGRGVGVNVTPASFIVFEGKVVDTIPGAQLYNTIIKQLSEIE